MSDEWNRADASMRYVVWVLEVNNLQRWPRSWSAFGVAEE